MKQQLDFRNWNVNSLPSILLRIRLHSITSPSNCFKLWWNQWETAANWPSKGKQADTGSLAATEEINLGCRGSYRWTVQLPLTAFFVVVDAQAKRNTAHCVVGHKADVTKYETTPVTIQQALCLMGILSESRAFMKIGHLACKDRKRQRTKLAPFFHVRKPSWKVSCRWEGTRSWIEDFWKTNWIHRFPFMSLRPCGRQFIKGCHCFCIGASPLWSTAMVSQVFPPLTMHCNCPQLSLFMQGHHRQFLDCIAPPKLLE